jgi:hypothetical protein
MIGISHSLSGYAFFHLVDLLVNFSHIHCVPVNSYAGRGRISAGGPLSQTEMGPEVQDPERQKSHGKSTLEFIVLRI